MTIVSRVYDSNQARKDLLDTFHRAGYVLLHDTFYVVVDGLSGTESIQKTLTWGNDDDRDALYGPTPVPSAAQVRKNVLRQRLLAGDDLTPLELSDYLRA